MKNYININGQNIPLTEQQVNSIKESFGINRNKLKSIKLKNIVVGKTFMIGTREFILLKHNGNNSLVYLRDLLFKNQQFAADSNNYSGSYSDKKCIEFAEEIKSIVGNDNVIPFTLDLTTDDGRKDYGSIERSAALLTADMRRRYVDILDNYPVEPSWEWLATADSTPKHGDNGWVKCVTWDGSLCSSEFYNGHGGRPFCILNSDIVVRRN